ncbi:sugar O-acyltransferase, sialic acid O-acetyltransferase NeuD family [Alteribacillus persepolensis]|uniref:Sugar O-acyltransferase, sialic acid O-acetyltransferase NeuD family n=1 Tax=Alteribacillus persepolensis TaxID=568899 RepID=A0A1G8ISE2_9BACI|nr:acetyltransferase [Alteribacillus persepolensis]SDI21400.1 sugar O-acyltransferase, sialic acid O-acetyltransferase NeuD family [Alteribacillus persepolensis]
MKKIIILGATGNCVDILDTIFTINQEKDTYECVGFLDDDKASWGKEIYGVKVLGPLSSAAKYSETCYFVNGIGSASNFKKKEEIISKTNIPLSRFETIIHPSANVSNMAQIGKGTVILQGVTIAANVKINNHVMVLPNSVVSHDTIIHDYSSITGGVCISGSVTIGKSCYLGTNCSIINNITIGDYSLIGMGSVVLKSVPDNSVMAGSPAKKLKR